MPKIIKIIISILIAVCITVNPFCGILNVTASAAAPAWLVPLIIEFLISAGEGIILGGAAYEFSELAADSYDHEQFTINQLEQITAGIGCEDGLHFEVENDPVGKGWAKAYIRNSDKLTAEQLEFAEFFCDYVNSNPFNVSTNSEYVGIGEGNYYYLTPEEYTKVKNTVSELYTQYNFEKYAEECIAHGNSELANTILSGGQLPVYNFDFVGPLPYMTIPSTSALGSITTTDGFIYSTPVHSSELNGVGKFKTASAAKRIFTGVSDYIDEPVGDEIYGYASTATINSYGYATYILYDGEFYYTNQPRYFGQLGSEIVGNQHSSIAYLATVFYTADGKRLSDTDIVTTNDYYLGFVSNIENKVASAHPTIATTTDISEFETETGGGTVEIPRTDDEQTIANALELGLLTDDSMLTIGEDGKISAADGIDLATIESMLEKIANGQLEFEDIQQYLDLITQLIANGNVTETEQSALLANIEKAAKAQTKSIDELNEIIKSLSEYLTVGDDLEIENTLTLPNVEDIEITMGGMPEAEMLIAESLPIVEQCKTLITNLFQEANKNDDVPNFSFYWDSNKDGEKEKYTIFDLSFMEHTLSNENLDDKNRFRNAMTVREFVQSLIILVVYSTFALKILKKIPALFGLGESGGDVNSVTPTDVSGQITIKSDKNANW